MKTTTRYIVLCVCMYVQWTTDEDIYETCRQIGVKDIIDIKFYENRVNGQSKGFCMIFIGSEASYRACMDRLGKKSIHGQNPVVTFTNKQALHQVHYCHSTARSMLLSPVHTRSFTPDTSFLAVATVFARLLEFVYLKCYHVVVGGCFSV